MAVLLLSPDFLASEFIHTREVPRLLGLELPSCRDHCLDLRLRPTELIGWLETALQAARQLGRRAWEGRALGNLGSAYGDLGETRRAIELHEQSLAIKRSIGDRRGEANSCLNLGLALEKLGELGRAAAMMQVHVDYLREIGLPDAEKRAAYVEALRARMEAPDATPD